MTDSASNATRPVWIDPSWLSWEYRALQYVPEGSGGFDPSDTTTSPTEATARLYDIHQHACDRFEGEPSRDDRGDAIMALRRVVGRRVKELKEIYELRNLPTGVKPKYDSELLEYFGIIRPFMLKRLIDLRNSVEHEDSSPPPTDECLMFADLVWYFLRSTDKLVHGRVGEIDFEGHISDTDIETRDFFSVRVRFWQSYVERPNINIFLERPHIYAFLDSSSVSYQPRASWMRVEATNIARHEEERIDPPLIRAKTDVYGDLNCTDEQMKRVYELYFRISHFV